MTQTNGSIRGLMDFLKKSCELLCEDKAENTTLVTNDNWFENFYDIAVTWSDIIDGSDDLADDGRKGVNP